MLSSVLLGWMVFGVVSSLYVNTGNPYSDGKLGVKNVTLDRTSTAPMHMTVFHPNISGEYPVFYFVPGAPEGIIPSTWYSDVLSRIVSHGFIVLAVDAFWPLVDLRQDLEGGLVQRHLDNIRWLRANLSHHLTGVTPSWSHSALGCHSAGCDVTLKMLQSDPQVTNSTIFLEPFSIAIQSKSKYNVPAYMYATQFAEEFGPFPCNIPGTDYNAFYKHWTANKWFTEVANYGHCDALDKFPWETCHIGHFCKTVGDWSRVYPVYHQYLSGAMSAFLIGTLQGNTQTLNYIQDTKLMPLPMVRVNHTVY